MPILLQRNLQNTVFISMKFVFLAGALLATIATANAYKVEGIITDSTTGETLVGAVVSCKELPGVGTTSGLDG